MQGLSAESETILLQGPVGTIEMLSERLQGGTPKGMALIAHPHPLYSGSMHNKVVQTMAQAFVQSGWEAVRFNFRGVGQSQGMYDEGWGELQDFLSIITQRAPQGSLAMAGFSFGAFVASHALAALWEIRNIEKVVLVGTATSRFVVANMPAATHTKSLVIHGENDDVVPLSSVLDWARPQNLPITVVPQGGHFFHGQLPVLKNLVLRHLAATV